MKVGGKEEYKKRKIEEVKILNKYSESSFSLKENFINKDLIFTKLKQKEEIICALRKKFFNFTETGFYSKKKVKISPFLYARKYSYQRCDLFFENEYLSSKLYNIDLQNIYYTYFTNCGMSAISNFFFALNAVSTKVFNIFINKDSYFEVLLFMDFVNLKNIVTYNSTYEELDSNVDNYNILYLDSVSLENPYKSLIYHLKKDISEFFIVVIDTTCINIGTSRIFKKIVKEVTDKGVFCIFLRSHTKLDFLATEYSRLGSVVFIKPSKTTKNKLAVFERIVYHYSIARSYTGSAPHIYDIPPFLVDNEFKNLNSKRIKAIRNNHKLLAKLLQNHIRNGNLVKPYHNLFVLIKSKKQLSVNDIKKILSKFAKEYKNDSYPLLYATSFGFDFIAMDDYVDSNKKNVIRISLPDYPAEVIVNFSKQLDILIKMLS